jgi:hypothetical protein
MTWHLRSPLATPRGHRDDGTTLPEFYIGRCVKRAFGSTTAVQERLWVHVRAVTAEGDLTGPLLNEPVGNCGVHRGDWVVVPRALIEEVAP